MFFSELLTTRYLFVIDSHLLVDAEVAEHAYCVGQLRRFVDLTRQFHGGQADAAFRTIDSPSQRDNLVDAVRRLAALVSPTGTGTRFLLDVVVDEDDEDPTDLWWTTLASVEGATFLDEFLPEDAYIGLYEALERGSLDLAESRAAAAGGQGFPEDDGSVLTRVKMDERRCHALCCCAYRQAVRGRADTAAVYAARAYELLPSTSTATDAAVDVPAAAGRSSAAQRAFCALCLALVYRICPSTTSVPIRDEVAGDRPVIGGLTAAATLARRALDGYRAAGGPTVVGQIYAAELLATTLADIGQTQSALNVCRASDELEAALGTTHPVTVDGTELRRRLWAGLGLVERTRRAAVAAGQSAARYHGDEHPVTATALANVCEAVGRAGSVDDAVCVGIRALALRVKVREIQMHLLF